MKPLLAAAGVLALVSLAACSVEVREQEFGNADVDVRTPVGSVSVRSDVDTRETGLPPYPGAVPSRDPEDADRARVNIGTRWFGVKVVAMEFETTDVPQRVLDFYRAEMKAFGTVTECRGDVDFRGSKGAKRPVCRESRSSSAEVQLVTGTEERQRIVSVKPRGNGSEFALVYVETRGDD